MPFTCAANQRAGGMFENRSPHEIHGASSQSRRAPRSLASFGDGEHPSDGSQLGDEQVSALRQDRAQRDVGLPSRQVTKRLSGIELEAQGRVASEQLTEERSEHDLGDVRWARHANGPRDLALQTFGRVGEARHHALHLLGDREQVLCGLGRRDALTASIEQRRTHRAFEECEAPRDRRGIHAERLTGAADRARATERKEQPDVVPMEILVTHGGLSMHECNDSV